MIVAKRLRLEDQVHGRAYRCDHDGRRGVFGHTRQAFQRAEPLGELVGIIGQAVIRQRIGFGKQQDGLGIGRPGTQLVGIATCLGRSADDQQHRPIQGSVQRRQRVGPRWRDGRQKLRAGSGCAQRLDERREARVSVEDA